LCNQHERSSLSSSNIKNFSLPQDDSGAFPDKFICRCLTYMVRSLLGQLHLQYWKWERRSIIYHTTKWIGIKLVELVPRFVSIKRTSINYWCLLLKKISWMNSPWISAIMVKAISLSIVSNVPMFYYSLRPNI
jgi:hypothetical protein